MKIALAIATLSIGCSGVQNHPLPKPSEQMLSHAEGNLKILFAPPKPLLSRTLMIPKNEGTMVIDITVDPTGRPTGAKAISGPEALIPIYESYALQWRFEPYGTPDAPAIAHFTLTIPIHFRSL